MGHFSKNDIPGSLDLVWRKRVDFADNTWTIHRNCIFLITSVVVVLLLFLHFHRVGIQACQGHISGILDWLAD